MTLTSGLHHRTLGRTGLEVSEIGFGAWGIGGGWGERDDPEGIAALDAAIDHGIDFIDTAMGYGDGHSEELIGVVLARRSENVAVATKAAPMHLRNEAKLETSADEAFPVGYLRKCTEASLTRLGLERIDVQQMHYWAPRWLHEGDWQDEVAALKREGKIGGFGVSIADHQPHTALELVNSGLVDTVQVIHNIFDQSPEDALFDACRLNNVGVIVRVALDEGSLAGAITRDTTFPDGDWRQRYFRDDRPAAVAEHIDAILSDLGIPVEQLAATALRYVLSFEAVSTVIVGMRSVRNVTRNVGVADGVGLPADVVARLHAHRWERDFYA